MDLFNTTEKEKIFWVLEGLDGVGKSSVGQIIANELDCDFLDSLPSPFLERYVEFNTILNPASFYLFMLSQINHLSENIKDKRLKGRGVIVARYFPTTVAYAIANSAIEGDGTQFKIDPRDLGIELPDHIFYLYTTNAERRRRLEAKGKLNYGDNISLQEERIKIIKREFSNFPMTSIDTTNSEPKAIAESIIKMGTTDKLSQVSHNPILKKYYSGENNIKDFKMQVGLGTWNFSGVQKYGEKILGWPEMNTSIKENILNVSLNNGIKFIDTSDFYGEGSVEITLGNFLKGKDDIIVATKGGLLHGYDSSQFEIKRNYESKYISSEIENSRQRLQRDKIDLYQLHGPDITDIENKNLWDALQTAVDKGKIGRVGISLRKRWINHDFINKVIKNPLIYSVQLPVDLSNNKLNSLITLLRTANKKIIGRSPFNHGLLFKDSKSDFLKDDQRLDFVDDKILEDLKMFRNKITGYASTVNTAIGSFWLSAIIASGLYDLILFGSTNTEQAAENSSLQLNTAPEINYALEQFLTEIMGRQIRIAKNEDANGLHYNDFR